MAFEDLKEKITNQAKNIWDSIQDSSVYIDLRDRFENLSPVMQKVVLGAAATTLSLVILSFPYGSLISSDEFKTQFEDTRKLTQDLLKAARESSNIPQVPPPPRLLKLCKLPCKPNFSEPICCQNKSLQLIPFKLPAI
ncbi:MAG: hypothetical protein ACK5WZ_08170 [Pseudobdellovibrionaceae bacterium]